MAASVIRRGVPAREKTLSAQGFSADWKVSSLATDAQSRFPCGVASSNKSACAEGMAVAFVDPVHATALSERAVKYGELFIALTFVGLGLYELLRRIKVHPAQYLLIGAALAVVMLSTRHIHWGTVSTGVRNDVQ